MKRKKNINLVVGTNNPGKLREIMDLLPKNLVIYSPKDFKLKSPKENGKSFKENSLIKAKFFSKKSRMPCLADDSGLEINILNKKKGQNGFGYDPIFKPLNKRFTFGQMKSKNKYKIDHRFQAFKKIKKFF